MLLGAIANANINWAWLLLGLACLRLLLMVNLFRPIKRPGLLNLASFFAGWWTGELIHFVLLLDSIAILFFAQVGALHHPIGQGAMVLTVLTWFGFHLHQQSAKDAEIALDRALQKSHGKEYRTLLDTTLSDRLNEPKKFSKATLWLPFWMAHRDVERHRNIAYHEEGKLRLRLDLYRPKTGSPYSLHDAPETLGSGYPILLQIHGGAWIIGTKDHQGLPLMNHMAARGWLCASINYRLSPRATFPDPLHDVKRAIAWLRQHAGEFGGDPEFIVVTGGSAGAHLAALSALTANQPAHQPGFEDIDTSVAACVPFYGVYNLTKEGKIMDHLASRLMMEQLVFKVAYDDAPERYEAASPQRQIHPDAPPFFVIHGDADALAPIEETRQFAQTLATQSKQSVTYAELPYVQHAFDVFHSRRSLYAVYAVARFLFLLHHQYETSLTQAQDDPGAQL